MTGAQGGPMKSRPRIVVGWSIVLVSCAAGLASVSGAQTWSWPDSAKNLKVLPKDTDKNRLRSTMIGFTRSLGVRCEHCHVGKAGEPLDKFDFVSDRNPKKDVARGMLKMVGSVNDQLKQIQPEVPDRVTVSCVTCHHGVARPRTLVDELTLTYDKSGADSTVSRYRALRAAYDNAGAYDFREHGLNQLGGYAVGKKDYAGAITLLRLNEQHFPESASVHFNLGEAYRAVGDTAKAVAEYQRARQLDPRQEGAVRALKELGR